MSARTKIATMRCTWPGCEALGRYEYDNQREYADVERRRPTYRCTRHYNDGKDVLGADNPLLTNTYVVVAAHGSQFWQHEGEEDHLSSGFSHGPGFKAYATDFPVGTRLRVTAEVVAARPGGDGGGESG